MGVEVIGTTAYLAAAGAGLQSVDVSDPTEPTLVAFHDEYATEVAIEGEVAYVAASGLRRTPSPTGTGTARSTPATSSPT